MPMFFMCSSLDLEQFVRIRTLIAAVVRYLGACANYHSSVSLKVD